MGKFPNSILQCQNLRYLHLGVNELTSVPDLSKLPLETIKLHKNHLKDITPFEAKYVNLYLNPIHQLPKFLFDLDIRFLSWGGNGVKSLSGVENWKNCEWLSFVATNIEAFDEVCALSQLKGIRMPKNKIQSIPQDIGNLQKLEHLSLYKNRIINLPNSFEKLRLTKLNLAGNNIEDQSNINKDYLVWSNLGK